jgi:hypothetical protein
MCHSMTFSPESNDSKQDQFLPRLSRVWACPATLLLPNASACYQRQQCFAMLKKGFFKGIEMEAENKGANAELFKSLKVQKIYLLINVLSSLSERSWMGIHNTLFSS